MDLLYDKSEQDLNNETTKFLIENNIVTSPGGAVKLLLNIQNKLQADFYTTLRVNMLMHHITTSKGAWIDSLAVIVNCYRYTGESDDDFKFRVEHQILAAATSNSMAVRLAILSIANVEDVSFDDFKFGSGSFIGYIVTSDKSLDQSLIQSVINAVTPICGFGIKFDITVPYYLEVVIKVKLYLNTVTDTEEQSILIDTTNAIKDYFSSINIGQPIIVDTLSEKIKSVSTNILSFQCYEIDIDGKQSMFTDQKCYIDERFIIADNNSIMVT